MGKRRREPVWLSRLAIDAIQSDQIREHGGMLGVRDENALESALARAKHKWHFGGEDDLAALAAAYGYALVRNHPYLDGNKRIGLLAIATFLGVNGRELEATDTEAVETILRLADGRLSEARLAAWIRERAKAAD